MIVFVASVVSLATFSIYRRNMRHNNRHGLIQLKKSDSIVIKGTPPSFVLCLDLDETLVSDQCPEATKRFNKQWLQKFVQRGGVLVYNTGRALSSYKRLVERFEGSILRPQVLVAAEGHSIYWFAGRGAEDPPEDESWALEIDQGWDVWKVRGVVRELQSQHPDRISPPPVGPNTTTNEQFRESVIVADRETAEWAAGEVQQRLHKDHPQLEVQVIFCGGGPFINDWYWVGVIPARSGKGHALSYVLKRLGAKPSQALVAGDSGNDISMFQVPGVKGIVVANAQTELKESVQETKRTNESQAKNFLFSEQKYADAIVDGLNVLL